MMLAGVFVFLIVIPLLYIVFLAGMWFPQHIIDPGIEQFAGEDREDATEFYQVVNANFTGIPDVYGVSAVRVTSLRACPSGSDVSVTGTAQLYTFAAIPYGEGTVTCDGSVVRVDD